MNNPKYNQDAPMGRITHIEFLPEGYVHLCVKRDGTSEDLCCLEFEYDAWMLFETLIRETLVTPVKKMRDQEIMDLEEDKADFFKQGGVGG